MTDGIIGRLTNALSKALDGAGETMSINTRTGFPAASVDLGQLKSALETSIERMTMTQVRERWDDDLRQWMMRLIASWVQRCKCMQLQLGELGVGVKLETQDDHGYYEYRFSVMPGRDEGP